jgi:hypothetical protein
MRPRALFWGVLAVAAGSLLVACATEPSGWLAFLAIGANVAGGVACLAVAVMLHRQGLRED